MGEEEEGLLPARSVVPVEDQLTHREKYARMQRQRKRSVYSIAVPTSAAEKAHVKKRHSTVENPQPWQVKLLEFLNSERVQHFLIALLVLDVTILFIELGIDAMAPSCTIITNYSVSCCPPEENFQLDDNLRLRVSRMLADGGHHEPLCEAPLEETDYPAGCDSHKYPGVHTAHTVLFIFTIIILSIFEIELLLMLYLLGPKKFFSHFLYVLDLFIVTTSLVLEILFKTLHQDVIADLVGLLMFFRIWRFVRIGHGLAVSTFELQEEKIHELKLYIHQLEDIASIKGFELPKERPSSLLEESEHDGE